MFFGNLFSTYICPPPSNIKFDDFVFAFVWIQRRCSRAIYSLNTLHVPIVPRDNSMCHCKKNTQIILSLLLIHCTINIFTFYGKCVASVFVFFPVETFTYYFQYTSLVLIVITHCAIDIFLFYTHTSSWPPVASGSLGVRAKTLLIFTSSCASQPPKNVSAKQ